MKAGLAALVIVTGAALDLAAKAWARATLEPYGEAIELLPILSLRLTFNEGVSFSLLSFDGQLAKTVLLVVTGLITTAFTVWAFRSQGAERLALSVIVAGALANLIDRAIFGVVTDFLDLHFGAWNPFVFNLADVWISAGVALVLVAQLIPPNPKTSISF